MNIHISYLPTTFNGILLYSFSELFLGTDKSCICNKIKYEQKRNIIWTQNEQKLAKYKQKITCTMKRNVMKAIKEYFILTLCFKGKLIYSCSELF